MGLLFLLLNLNLAQKLQRLEKWFFEKAHLIRIAANKVGSTIPLRPRMGDVYLAKLGTNVGHETDKMRPVLVFQGIDRYIRISQTVFVFPITSNAEKRKYRVLFSESDVESGVIFPGSILIQQGRTISTFRFDRKIGRLQKKKLLEVRKAFDELLYKNTPLEINDRQGEKG